MFEEVKNFLTKKGLLCSGDTYLVGFSGGFDSMCLLHILNRLGLKVVAVHLNHNWRGAESDEEEENCAEFCEKYKIPFCSKKLDAAAKKTETAAREARQKFFKECYEKYDAKGLFLAHTKSDNAETVIYRMIKGTGIKGLCGIAKHNSINGCQIFRPLMNFSRKDIENYCRKFSLNPNNDSSNNSVKYKRNFIRHKILPEMKEINPEVEDKLYNLSQIAVSQERIINEYLGLIENKVKVNGKFLTAKFLEFSEDVQKRFIMNFLIENSIDYDSRKVDEILEFIYENHGASCGKTISLTEKLMLLVNKDYIYPVAGIEKCFESVEITGCGTYEFCGYTFCAARYDKELPEKFPSEREYYAYTCSLPFPLSLRFRKDGDIINPFGMDGSMKLKKFFINKHIPKPERNGIILLCKNEEVLWAAGCCLSNKLRCGDIPEYVIKLEKR